MKKNLLLFLSIAVFPHCRTHDGSALKVDTDLSSADEGTDAIDFTRYITPESQDAALEAVIKNMSVDGYTPTFYESMATYIKDLRSGKDPKRPAIPEGPKDYELIAIRHYTVESHEMNGLLRKLVAYPEKKSRETVALIKAASSGLNKIKGESCTAYRGTFLPDSIFKQLRVGAHYYDQGFLSTSYGSDSAFPGNYNITISSHNCKKIDSVAYFSKEKEVLFPPGSDFLVTDIKTENDVHYIYLLHRYLDKNEKLQSQKIAWDGGVSASTSADMLNKSFASVTGDSANSTFDNKVVLIFRPNGQGALTLSTGVDGGSRQSNFNWKRAGNLIETSVEQSSTKIYYYVFSPSLIGQLRAKNAEEIDAAKEIVTYFRAK